ncbi:S-layer homology domain-containing protein [Paenibacillus terreus]|uniref:S-layer homology domain-containing protein n=1 Tax=Paenibacillus terreus TaxID=1387834 RepID=A0ABV5B440_9BACL
MKGLTGYKAIMALSLALILTASTLFSWGWPVRQAHAEEGISQGEPSSVQQSVYGTSVRTAVTEAVYKKTDLALQKAFDYIENSGGVDSDWFALSYGRTGRSVPQSYQMSLVNEVKKTCGQSTVTTLARQIIESSAIDWDATKFTDCNAVAKLYNASDMPTIYASIYALIALDSGSYDVPADAKWTRDKLVDSIVTYLEDPSYVDGDLYGMALSALGPYRDQADVQTAGEQAVSWLATNLDDASSESISQAIVGLASFELDPTAAQFANANGDLIQRLLAFQNSDGGFKHALNIPSSDKEYATEQAMRALIAYDLFTAGEGTLYVNPTKPALVPPPPSPDSEPAPEPEPVPGSVQATVFIEGPTAPVAEDVTKAVYALDALKNVTVKHHIALETSSEGFINSIGGIKGGNTGYWSYAVKRGGEWINPNVGAGSFKLNPSDQVYFYFGGYGTSLIDSITSTPASPGSGEPVSVQVQKAVWEYDANYNATKVVSPAANVQVQIGSQTVITNEQGIASFKGFGSGTYTVTVTGYKTNDVPTVVRNTSMLIVGNGGGSGTTPVTQTITLSVTGTGTILPATQVRLVSGDTPYSVLIRGLGAGRVTASGSGSAVYVTAIDGLAEFDRGPNSGWYYTVNGEKPNVGAGAYRLSSGDVVDWKYTTDYKTDSNLSGGGTSAAVGTFPASVPSQVVTALNIISLSPDNKLPIGQAGQATSVINASSRMSADEAEKITEALAASARVSLSQMVSSQSGATMTDSAGKVQFIIPVSSLAGPTSIGIHEQTSSRPELVAGLYDFTPDGTSFSIPAYLSFKIPVQSDRLNDYILAWLDEDSGEWIPVPAVLDARTGIITGKIAHFTKYAVIDSSRVNGEGQKELNDQIAAAVNKVQKSSPLSDWEAIGVARSGGEVPSVYLQSVRQQLTEAGGTFRKVTDLERMALGVRAAGGDPTSIAGYNLIEKIYNHDRMTSQGLNGPIFALIALDSGDYKVPADAVWNRDSLLKSLLAAQNPDGGFPLSTGDESGVDITAMAVTALSTHADRADVQTAIDKAVLYLSNQQQNHGGYQANGDDNSESVAQVIVALASVGISPADERFTKPGGDLLTRLNAFRQNDGGYAHNTGGGSNAIATEQALLALDAYRLYLNNDGRLFSFTTATLGTDTPGTDGGAFVDEQSISAWAVDAVHEAYNAGLMLGVSGSELRFAPKAQLTRAQFAALVLRLTGDSSVDGTITGGFSDVSADKWYYEAVMTARAKGIVQGISADQFKPEQAVSRQDMAVMLARAFNLDASTSVASFKDQSRISGYALPSVRAVYDNGLMVGNSGNFDPASKVTREMAAVVAVHLKQKQLVSK